MNAVEAYLQILDGIELYDLESFLSLYHNIFYHIQFLIVLDIVYQLLEYLEA